MKQGHREAGAQAFGHLLRKRRHLAGFTQAELAERADMSVYSVSNLERGVGHTPRPTTVRLLTDALGLEGSAREAFQRAAWELHGPHDHDASDAAPTTPFLPEALAGDDDAPCGNLPIAPTPLIGRDEELRITSTIVCRRDRRLLTLVGTPGVGKTCLALEVAGHCAREFADGAFFVPLAAVNDADQVPASIARALGSHFGGSDQSLAADVLDVLRFRQVLLVLDNCEHLPDIAPLLADLLAACSRMQVLATSRAPLSVRGEQLFTVPPLQVPAANGATTLTVEALAKVPAVAVFVARAQAAYPAFVLEPSNLREVTAICRRLDGLPLALELVAPHVRVLPTGELLRRLDQRLPYLSGGPRDLPARQRSLRATFDWSYDLLTEHARAVLCWLGAFRGGAAMEAVEAVAGACAARSRVLISVQDGPHQLLEAVEELVAHNLAQQESRDRPGQEMRVLEGASVDSGVRITQLETVREYAEERLSAAGEEEYSVVRDAHAAWCLALAEQAAPALQGLEQATWLARLERERSNLMAAFAWIARRGMAGESDAADAADAALRLAVATYHFWLTRAPLETGRAWLEQGLALTSDRDPAGKDPQGEVRARRALAFHALGTLASEQGDVATARTALQEALQLRDAAGDVAGAAATLNNLGLVELAASNMAVARRHFAAALVLRRQVGDAHGIASTLNNLGMIQKTAGAYGRAVATLTAAARRARAVGDDQIRAAALANRADALRMLGRLVEAEDAAKESLTVRRLLGDRQGMGQVAGILGSVAEAQGNKDEALAYYHDALRHFRAAGAPVGMLEALTAIALLCAQQQAHVDAVRLLTVVEHESRARGVVVWDSAERQRVARALDAARAALGDGAFADVQAVGTQLSMHEALGEEIEVGDV